MEREVNNILNEKCRKLFGFPPYATDNYFNPSYLNQDFYDELCEQYGKEKVDLTYTMLLEREGKKMKKYRLIDDALCDINEDIPCCVDCQDCEYFFDCMEEDTEDTEGSED